jgi:radical SAM superfamily enzyme YgiQ (UPF0313 family)
VEVLLVRPSANERFGLGPFFRTEPLGLEYLAAAIRARGHDVAIVDLRLERASHGARAALRGRSPALVGISAIHTIDLPSTLVLAREIKRAHPGAVVVVGGHGASASPEAFDGSVVDYVGFGAGEESFPRLIDALGAARAGSLPRHVDGFHRVGTPLVLEASKRSAERIDPDLLPARDLVAHYRRGYRCVHRAPVWALETARGCPFRCSFCAVGRNGASASRGLDAVVKDFANVGGDIFVVDDLFFYPRDRSLELADRLSASGIRKDWLLVQTRTDTVARSAAVLEKWRPRAGVFDLFMGFEAASDEGLGKLQKDATLADAEEAVRVARALRFGVTGNFVVDPDWTEDDFERLWATLERLKLDRVGFTVLTPLPGTQFYDDTRARLVERDWARWDMHHVLWEPRLGRRRFYELVVASWKRNVLASRHASRRWLKWFAGIGPRDALALLGLLWRTQRLVDVDAYLADTFPMVPSD